jgi:hypothetical protein
MNADNSPGTALKSLLAQRGQQLANDPDATLQLLTEACPGATQEVEAIVAAQRLRIPWDMLNSGGLDAAKLDQLSHTLSEQGAMPLDSAKWIVQTWLKALDLTVSTPQATAPAVPEESVSGDPTPIAEPIASSAPSYYVIGAEGAKYGPADVPTLNQWVTEGRVHPTTLLEDVASARTMNAQEVAGLFFHSPQGQQAQPGPQQPFQPGPAQGVGLRPENPQPYNPSHQGQYYRPVGVADADLEKKATWSLVLSIISIFGCCILGFAGLSFSLNGRSALSAGDYEGAKSKLNTAMIFGYIGIVLFMLNVARIFLVLFSPQGPIPRFPTGP